MMVWNVYVGDWNGSRIKVHNVFDHGGFFKDCQRNYKENKNDREAFTKRLRRDLMYYYWSKTEWEVLVHFWPPRDGDPETKIDVYDQVMMHWDIFADYVWANKEELREKKK